MNWIKLNTPVKLYTPSITRNYYAPLTSRVDKLERANIIFTRPAPQQQHGIPTNSSKTLSVRCKAKPSSGANISVFLLLQEEYVLTKRSPQWSQSKGCTSKGSGCISLVQPAMLTRTARNGGDNGKSQLALARYDDSLRTNY